MHTFYSMSFKRSQFGQNDANSFKVKSSSFVKRWIYFWIHPPIPPKLGVPIPNPQRIQFESWPR